MRDLHLLPKVRDSLSFLYVEHARIEQEAKAIAIYDAVGKTAVPCAAITTLLVGPGTNVTHAAIRTLAECGCLVLWTGEAGVRLYAQGLGETRSSRLLQQQARLWADRESHMAVVRRMYELRFGEAVPSEASLEEIRGREGARVRRMYERYSRATGVAWSGRQYERGNWNAATPVNRAVSAANACLYGVCHSAILSIGCSPALGFIHTGRQLSFVYDIADLYKTEVTIPTAFAVVAEGPMEVERRVRKLVRDVVVETRLLSRVVPDIKRLLEADGIDVTEAGGNESADGPSMPPGDLWDDEGDRPGGINWDEQASEGV